MIDSCIVELPLAPAAAHLALEDWLLDNLAPEARVLLLYRSQPAVVLGKNQNLWRETDPAVLATEGVALARRVSGGGAVYHDPGNLNFAFLVPREGYDGDALSAVVLTALRSLGVAAELGPRSVLQVDGRKISGNAFCYRRQWTLHHGTLLLSADLARLSRCLQPALPELATHAVASVRSPVLNLGLAAADVVAALVAAWRAELPGGAELPLYRGLPPAVDANALADCLRKHVSTEWLYDMNPTFICPIETPSGELRLRVRHGHIQGVEPAGDSRAAVLDKAWRDTRFKARSMRAALLAAEPPVEASIHAWLAKREF